MTVEEAIDEEDSENP